MLSILEHLLLYHYYEIYIVGGAILYITFCIPLWNRLRYVVSSISSTFHLKKSHFFIFSIIRYNAMLADPSHHENKKRFFEFWCFQYSVRTMIKHSAYFRYIFTGVRYNRIEKHFHSLSLFCSSILKAVD